VNLGCHLSLVSDISDSQNPGWLPQIKFAGEEQALLVLCGGPKVCQHQVINPALHVHVIHPTIPVRKIVSLEADTLHLNITDVKIGKHCLCTALSRDTQTPITTMSPSAMPTYSSNW
jgi:hypothetical protein